MSHVALVIPGFGRIGGAERQVILLARGLCQRGWRVSVIALSGSGDESAAELTEAGAGFKSLRMRKGLADPRGMDSLPPLAQAGEAGRGPRAPAPRYLAGSLVKAGRAVTRAGGYAAHSSTGTRGRQLGYRWSGWLTDKVTAVSQAVAEAYFYARMVTADKLTVLPNGVDADAWRPDAAVRNALRSELNMEDKFLWLAAGRLEAVKDYPSLLRAMVEVPESARLVIAGSGPLENDLLRLSTLLGLERQGPVDRL
jgi:glycosyltransferase involved in cell wall biosynthesis